MTGFTTHISLSWAAGYFSQRHSIARRTGAEQSNLITHNVRAVHTHPYLAKLLKPREFTQNMPQLCES